MDKVTLTEQQLAELRRRDAELEAHPGSALTWEQIRASIETKSRSERMDEP